MMNHHPSDRATAGAIDFDSALEGYASGYRARGAPARGRLGARLRH
jgi:hypothetical protein